MVGIKETREALIGVNELTYLLVKHFKDGIQLTDFMKMWKELGSDPELIVKFKIAIEGWQSIPAEIADLDILESADLAETQMKFVKKLFSA